MARACILSSCILISLLSDSLHARIANRGVQPAQIGEKHYSITCMTDQSADIAEWRQISDGASVPVKKCFSSRFKAAMGTVCSGGTTHVQTLYFGPISMDSAGVYSCTERQFGSTKPERVRNVTIRVITSTVEPKTFGKAGTGKTEAVSGTSIMLETHLTTESDITAESPENGANGSGTYVGFLVVLIAISVAMMVLWLALCLVYVQRKCCRTGHQTREQQGIETSNTRECDSAITMEFRNST